jgi:excisionase family DNA binding protein
MNDSQLTAQEPSVHGSTRRDEQFVSTDTVAQFLSLSRRTIAKMAREGRIPAYPVSGSARRTWRFRLSEIAATISDCPSSSAER